MLVSDGYADVLMRTAAAEGWPLRLPFPLPVGRTLIIYINRKPTILTPTQYFGIFRVLSRGCILDRQEAT